MSYVVVTYDTPSDRRRDEMRRSLQGYLFHSQKSVFEGPLRSADVRRLRRLLGSLAHRREDAVRLFQLCIDCAARSESLAGRAVTGLPAAVFVDKASGRV
jgi:CRISPR-associated endonuclease Cas2